MDRSVLSVTRPPRLHNVQQYGAPTRVLEGLLSHGKTLLDGGLELRPGIHDVGFDAREEERIVDGVEEERVSDRAGGHVGADDGVDVADDARHDHVCRGGHRFPRPRRGRGRGRGAAVRGGRRG